MAAVNDSTTPFDGSGINQNDGSSYDLNPNGWNGTTYTKPPPGQHWDDKMASFQPDAQGSGMPTGIDPALAAIYQKAGQTPGGAGSGFADWQYWQGKGPSQYARLAADIAGTGTDQTTGTPWGAGAWQGSGQGQPTGAPQSGSAGALGSVFGNIGSLITSLMTSPSANINTAPSTNIVGNTAGQTQGLLDTLKGRADQSLSIDPTTDPIIRNQVDNYGANQTRAARNMVNTMAESSNPYQTGAATAAGVQANEKASQNTSDLQASLVANELQNRRSEIQNALSESGSMISQQDQLALQDELGKINAQIQNRQVTSALGLGLGQLALGQEGLDSNNDQFAANYGLNASQMANYWDMLRSGAR